ncbi:MAG: hypothetical protein HY547_01995 [Elusimicrobia bacterium]|nr:hypothetical protein [Elusimicrobiota bacterium]
MRRGKRDRVHSTSGLRLGWVFIKSLVYKSGLLRLSVIGIVDFLLIMPSLASAFVIHHNPSKKEDRIMAIAQDYFFVYLGGYDNVTGSKRWRIERRRKSDGSLSNSFGRDGVLVDDVSSGDDFVTALAIEPPYLYVAGFAGSSWMIKKLTLNDGAADADFGIEGSLILDFKGLPLGVEVLGDRLYLFGSESLGRDEFWRIERRHQKTGILDENFAQGGVLKVNPTPGSGERLVSICVHDQEITLYGSQRQESRQLNRWRLEKRDLSSGLLIDEFGYRETPGMVVSEFFGQPAGMICRGESVVLIGSRQNENASFWKMESRLRKSGHLDQWYGSERGFFYGSGFTRDYPLALAGDDDRLYVTGVDQRPGDARWLTIKMSLATGQLDVKFGDDGFNYANPSDAFDSPQAAVVDENYLYLAGWDSINGDSAWRFEKRDKSSGASVKKFPLLTKPASRIRFPRVYSSLVSLAFDPPFVGETGYQIQRSSNGLNYDFFVATVPVPLSSQRSVSWVDTNVTAGTTYWYQITPFYDNSYDLILGKSAIATAETLR